jgi:uncharacterized membrane protein YhaH (DUF805 family)
MNANSKDYNDYKPNIGIRLIDALKTGWYILIEIVVFVFQIWWLFFIVIGSFLLYKKFIKKV